MFTRMTFLFGKFIVEHAVHGTHPASLEVFHKVFIEEFLNAIGSWGRV